MWNEGWEISSYHLYKLGLRVGAAQGGVGARSTGGNWRLVRVCVCVAQEGGGRIAEDTHKHVYTTVQEWFVCEVYIFSLNTNHRFHCGSWHSPTMRPSSATPVCRILRTQEDEMKELKDHVIIAG